MFSCRSRQGSGVETGKAAGDSGRTETIDSFRDDSDAETQIEISSNKMTATLKGYNGSNTVKWKNSGYGSAGNRLKARLRASFEA